MMAGVALTILVVAATGDVLASSTAGVRLTHFSFLLIEKSTAAESLYADAGESIPRRTANSIEDDARSRCVFLHRLGWGALGGLVGFTASLLVLEGSLLAGKDVGKNFAIGLSVGTIIGAAAGGLYGNHLARKCQ